MAFRRSVVSEGYNFSLGVSKMGLWPISIPVLVETCKFFYYYLLLLVKSRPAGSRMARDPAQWPHRAIIKNGPGQHPELGNSPQNGAVSREKCLN